MTRSRVASAELSSSLFVTAVSYAYPAFRDNGRLPLSVRDHGNMVHAATAVVCMGLINSVNTAMVTSSGHGYPIGYGHTMVIRNASLKFQRVRDIHPSLIIYRRVRVCSPIDTVYFTQSPWPFSLSTHLEGHSFILTVYHRWWFHVLCTSTQFQWFRRFMTYVHCMFLGV